MYVYICILYINTDSPVPCLFSQWIWWELNLPHGSLLVAWGSWFRDDPFESLSKLYHTVSVEVCSSLVASHHSVIPAGFILKKHSLNAPKYQHWTFNLFSFTAFTNTFHPFSFTSTDPILATRPPAATMRAISSFSCGLWSRVSCLAKLFRPSMPQLGGFFGSLVEVMHGWMSYKGLSLRKLVETRKIIIKCWILMDERKYCWTPNLCFAEKSTCPSLPQHLSPLFYTAMSNTSNVEPDPQLNGAKAPPTTTLLSPTLSHWAWARVRLESYRSCCFCWDQKNSENASMSTLGEG